MRKYEMKKSICIALSIIFLVVASSGMIKNPLWASESEDGTYAITATSGGAIEVSNSAVSTIVRDKENNVEFEVIRNKETYQFGEDIVLTIHAKNISNKVIKVGNSVSNMGIQGCLSSELVDAENNILYHSIYMRDGEIVKRMAVTDYSGQLNSNQTISGQQVIKTKQVQQDFVGEYYIRVGLERDYWSYPDIEERIYYVNIPVFMTGNSEAVTTLEAVDFVKDGITVTATDETGTFEFEISRDKECYTYGEDILLAIKAKNISNKPVTITAGTTTLGETECLDTQLLKKDETRLFYGDCMLKDEYYFVGTEGMFVDTAIYYKDVATGASVEGYQYIETAFEEGQVEGECDIEVAINCEIDGKGKAFSVKIPVYMFEGEIPIVDEEPQPSSSTTSNPISVTKNPIYSKMPDVVKPSVAPSSSTLPSASPDISVEPSDDNLTTAPSPSMPAESTVPNREYLQGDVDGNGSIELSDAQQALKVSLKITKVSQEVVKRTDMDNDGTVSLTDAQRILKKALRIDEV